VPPSRSRRFFVIVEAGVVAAVLLLAGAAYILTLHRLNCALNVPLEKLYAAGAPRPGHTDGSPPASSEANAAPLYLQAHRCLQESMRDGLDLLSFIYDRPSGSRRQLRGRAEGILARNQEPLALVKRAAAKPYCRFAVDPTAPDARVESVYEGSEAMEIAAELLAADAVLAAERGNLRDAVESCRLSVGMLRQAFAQPTIHLWLQGLPLPLSAVLQTTSPDGESCRVLYEALRPLDFIAAFRRAVAVEAYGRVRAFDDIGTDTGRRPFPNPFARLDRLRSKIVFAERAAAVPDIADKPLSEAMAACRALQRTGDRDPEGYGGLPSPLELQFGLLMRDSLALDRDAMQIALALKAYHAQRGAYPDSLRALHAYPGWKLPEDPFSGKDFGYRRKGAGFVLYSWGEDLRDDGGKRGWDIVFEFTR